MLQIWVYNSAFDSAPLPIAAFCRSAPALFLKIAGAELPF
jgi:hypothetical protein